MLHVFHHTGLLDSFQSCLLRTELEECDAQLRWDELADGVIRKWTVTFNADKAQEESKAPYS